MFNAIPVMDDPLGKHWDQPRDIREVLMDDTHVILTSDHIGQLSKYDATLPSGVYPGKAWMRREAGRTLLAWYGAENADKMCPILFREVLEIA